MKGNTLSTVAGFLTDVIEKKRGYNLPNCSQVIAAALLKVFRYTDLDAYRNFVDFLRLAPMSGRENIVRFVDEVIAEKKLRYEIEDEEHLAGGRNGIIVANHPLGVLDGIMLFHALKRLGRKSMFIASNKAAFLDRTYECIIPVRNRVDLHDMYAQVQDRLTAGYDIVVFPAGDISKYDAETGDLRDRAWRWTPLLRASAFEVPIYPIHLQVAAPTTHQQLFLKKERSQFELFKLNLLSVMRPDRINDIVLKCRPPVYPQGYTYTEPGIPLDKIGTSRFMEELKAYTYGKVSAIPVTSFNMQP